MPRNCTLVSPCQLDSPILRQAEMDAGMVDQCGRTQLAGDIPIATTAKDMASMNAVTKVTKGGSLVMTIHQINADGAGPYQCDLDQTGNGTSFMGNLPVTNNIPGANGLSQVSKTDFNITIAMPADMACNGGSTKDLCIVRCRNAALAGPFGGCVVVEQGDKTVSQLPCTEVGKNN